MKKEVSSPDIIAQERISFVSQNKHSNLDLSNLGIQIIPDNILELEHVTSLNLSYNPLLELPKSITALKNLKCLDLSFNRFSIFPMEILELSNLEELDLTQNNLREIPKEIGKLKRLLLLTVNYNSLISIPKEIGHLINLRMLSLYSNLISDLPNEIGTLKELTQLYLGHNQLNALPNEIKNLEKLRILELTGNVFSIFQEEILELKNLSELDISSNLIVQIPKGIKKLGNLKMLDLSNNEIKVIPREILDLKSLDGFYLDENKMESPPIQLVNQGLDAIREYFNEIEISGKDFIYEAKLLILGEPGAGKTTLARKLIDHDAELPLEEDTTRGIDIWQWKYKINHKRKSPEMNVNIWDFGGQSIYKATHRFFLTQRSFYVVVADARKEFTDFFYWMYSVELFGEDSPVVIVINEKENRHKNFDYHKLRGRFLNLQNRYDLNLKNIDDRFKTLEEDLKYNISKLPHIGDTVPTKWKNIRQEIKELVKSDNVIAKQSFFDICINYGITNRDTQEVICSFFHEIGVFLNFKHNDVLNKHVFLNKEWILDAVYSILDNRVIIDKGGKFKRADFENACVPEFSDYVPELIAMMKKFYLVYEKDGFIIAPQLLSFDPPEYNWDETENFHFQFSYRDYMPVGILWQFIVEMNSKIEKNLVWQNGVILKFKKTRAEIIENIEQRTITIRIKGEDIILTRYNIIMKFHNIHGKFNKLFVKKLIPCVCQLCKESSEPYQFDYEDVKRAENNKPNPVHELQCLKSYTMINISNLLKGFYMFDGKHNILEDILLTVKKIEDKLNISSDTLSNNLINRLLTHKGITVNTEEFEKILYQQNKELAEALYEGITNYMDDLGESLNSEFFEFKDQIKSIKQNKGILDNKVIIKVGLPLKVLTGIDIHYEGELNVNNIISKIFKKN